jgi:hypothetical protein
VLITGHADEIGLMVSAIGSDGTLMVTKIGGIYPTTYPGHKVRIYTKNGVIYGAVANSRSIAKNKELDASDLRIDIGATDREDAKKYVELGEYVSLAVSPGEGESRGAAIWREVESRASIKQYPVAHVYYYKGQLEAQYGYYAEQAGISYEEMLAEMGETESSILAQAKSMTKSDLVYAAIVKAESIEVSESEKQELFERYVEKYVSEYGYGKDHVRENMTDEIYGSMLYDKTTEFLLINNTVGEEEQQ